MNFYPTRYSELSNSEVNELYRSETWEGLNRDERLDALQELENRSAEACGNQPCEVRLEQMEGAQYGYYQDGQITINESLVESGELQFTNDDGSVQTYTPDDTNAQLMDTIHHENYHAYQDDAINGRVEHDNTAEVELWRANDDAYIRSSDPSGQYRIQSLEKSAFEHGETQTKAAFEEIEAKYGEDAGYQEYLSSIEQDSYENALAKAKAISGDENIEANLNEQMLQNYQESHYDSYAREVSNENTVDTSSIDSSTVQISNEVEDSL